MEKNEKEKKTFKILIEYCFCFVEVKVSDGCHFVRNRYWMFQLSGQVTRQGESPLQCHGQN